MIVWMNIIVLSIKLFVVNSITHHCQTIYYANKSKKEKIRTRVKEMKKFHDLNSFYSPRNPFGKAGFLANPSYFIIETRYFVYWKFRVR